MAEGEPSGRIKGSIAADRQERERRARITSQNKLMTDDQKAARSTAWVKSRMVNNPNFQGRSLEPQSERKIRRPYRDSDDD